MPSRLRPSTEPLSHVAADGAPGVLALHGFTGTPASMRMVAEAFVADGFHVELPRLTGHGTVIDDMLPTRWSDWAADAEAAYQRLAQRTDRVVVTGLSMGGSLALSVAFAHPGIDGLVLVNPATQPQGDDVREMLAEFLDEGMTIVPGAGSDVADPDAIDVSYDGAPIEPLLSFLADGLAPMTDRFGELMAPLLLFTSRRDHVIGPDQSRHLAATYGGPVDHRWLERSFHVATVDYDRDEIVAGALQFARQRTC
jgi:carboxylesterase